jgi:hypothetical protein
MRRLIALLLSTLALSVAAQTRPKLEPIPEPPPHGVPYYLIDNAGNGIWSRQDVRDSGLRVPMWVIGTF